MFSPLSFGNHNVSYKEVCVNPALCRLVLLHSNTVERSNITRNGTRNFGSNGFDFQNYEIYSMLNVNGQFALSQIPNNDPTLFTDDISNLGDALLLVSRTTTNGVRDVIVVVSGFGPFPGVPNNQSPVVAQELANLLEQEGIESQVVIIDVLWGEPDDRIDQVITDIACEHPDQQIVWIAFGSGGGFTLELRVTTIKIQRLKTLMGIYRFRHI